MHIHEVFAKNMLCLLQLTHVYSITEIHNIDDNDPGSIYIKVGFIPFYFKVRDLFQYKI